MVEKNEKRGGKRNGNGRKQLPDEKKKSPITFYVMNEDIAYLGGRPLAKEFAAKAFHDNLTKLKITK